MLLYHAGLYTCTMSPIDRSAIATAQGNTWKIFCKKSRKYGNHGGLVAWWHGKVRAWNANHHGILNASKLQ